jgi:hypothetical protein
MAARQGDQQGWQLTGALQHDPVGLALSDVPAGLSAGSVVPGANRRGQGEPIAALFRIPGFQQWFEPGDAPGRMIETAKHSVRCCTVGSAKTMRNEGKNGPTDQLGF